MFYPTFEDFEKLAKKGNLIPVYKEIVADMETPVSAFSKISSRSKYAYLLESVERGERLGRYSFISNSPSLIFKSKGRTVDIQTPHGKIHTKEVDDPLQELAEIMQQYKPVKVDGLPLFWGGAVGYIGYDMVRFFESIPDKNPDDLNMPDCIFVFTDSLLIFDHLNRTVKMVSCVHTGNHSSKNISRDRLKRLYFRACKDIDDLIELLKRPVKLSHSRHIFNIHAQSKTSFMKAKCNFTRKQFRDAVNKAKEYISSGDIIQAVLSQRFTIPIKGEPFNIYRALRMINPSSYMFHLKYDELEIVGSSPEMLVRLEGKKVEVRPIAGTRMRGDNDEEDKKLEYELLNDPKERAEHIMLVDLGRNDVGRVSSYGTVSVPELMRIEKYSHVQHIVSDVIGKLKNGKDVYDVMRACFPAGTVSGAPKIRAMEIIDELEPTRRGPYSGCVGYFGFSGNLDTCITIRTVVIKNRKAYIQVGAGIVADSVPDNEYIETLNKGRAMFKAIEAAEQNA